MKRVWMTLALAAAMLVPAAAAHAQVGVAIRVGPAAVVYGSAYPDPGYYWTDGYYDGPVWVPGRWMHRGDYYHPYAQPYYGYGRPNYVHPYYAHPNYHHGYNDYRR